MEVTAGRRFCGVLDVPGPARPSTVIRRHGAYEQESDTRIARGWCCSCCRDGAAFVHPGEDQSGNERLCKQPAPTGWCEGAVEIGEPQKHQRCSELGEPASLPSSEARLSPRRHLHTGASRRAPQVFSWRDAHVAAMTPNPSTLLDATGPSGLHISRMVRGRYGTLGR